MLPSRYRWMCPSFGTRCVDVIGTTFPPSSLTAMGTDAGAPWNTSSGDGTTNDSVAPVDGRVFTFGRMIGGRTNARTRHAMAAPTEAQPTALGRPVNARLR